MGAKERIEAALASIATSNIPVHGSLDPIFDSIFECRDWLAGRETPYRKGMDVEEYGHKVAKDLEDAIQRRVDAMKK